MLARCYEKTYPADLADAMSQRGASAGINPGPSSCQSGMPLLLRRGEKRLDTGFPAPIFLPLS